MILSRSCFVGSFNFLLLLFFSFALSCSKKQDKPKQAFARPVQVGTSIVQNVPNYISSFGYLKAINNVNIASQVTGKIEKSYFKEGQEVKKGDLLFTIDSRIYQAKIDEATAQLNGDLADVKTKQYIVDKDKKLALTNAIPIQDFVKYTTELEIAQAAVELDKATIEQNKINLDYCRITSPIDGVTGRREVDAGNIVIANSGPTLVNIKSIDPLYVNFTIPENNLFRVRQAMQNNKLMVIVHVEELGVEENKPDALYTGTLEFINNEVSTKTGTLFLRAVIPNPNEDLWPGQFVRVLLVLDIDTNALLVPYISVQQGLKGYYLFSIKDSKAILHYVTRGQKHDDYIAITVEKDAVKPGDKIVTVGQMGLAPNVGVKILKEDKFPRPLTPDYYLNKVKNKKPETALQTDTIKGNTSKNSQVKANN